MNQRDAVLTIEFLIGSDEKDASHEIAPRKVEVSSPRVLFRHRCAD